MSTTNPINERCPMPDDAKTVKRIKCPKCRHGEHNQHDCVFCDCDHQKGTPYASLPPLAAMRVDDERARVMKVTLLNGLGLTTRAIMDLFHDRAEMVRELARMREALTRIEAWPKRYGEDVDRINEMWAIAGAALAPPTVSPDPAPRSE